MENKVKVIIDLDEYQLMLDKIKNAPKTQAENDSEIGILLMRFITKVFCYNKETFNELENMMTDLGYSIKYFGENGNVTFGKGNQKININAKM